MSDRPYSRIYHELADEYPDLYDGPDLGGYVRLLVAADQAWPSRARWAGYVSEEELERIVATGLVIRDGSRYHVKGMDKERQTRRDAARYAITQRWDTARKGTGDTDRNTGRTTESIPSKDETSKDETSRAENAGAGDVYDSYYRLTVRTPSKAVMEWLDRLVADYTLRTVELALQEAWAADPSVKDLLGRVEVICTRASKRRHELEEEARKRAAAEARRREREEIESMPEEQRAANLARLREQLVATGLVKA